MHRAVISVSVVWLCAAAMPAALQSQGRTPSGPVGASMALLATFQDAGILPPEGSSAANRVIQIVIQFQGLFMKSTEPAVRAFVDEALRAKFGARAEAIAADFRQGGWTTEIVEAVCDRYARLPGAERANMAGSFARVNMRPEDLEWLSTLYDRARSTFDEQGRNIHHIFAEHRRNMPGGHRDDRKERRDGNEGLHTDQGEDGPDEGRLAVVEEALGRRASAFMLRPAGHFSVHQHAG